MEEIEISPVAKLCPRPPQIRGFASDFTGGMRVTEVPRAHMAHLSTCFNGSSAIAM